MEYAWLNLAALLLGLTAWMLPLTALLSRRAGKWVSMLSTLSMGACALSLLAVIAYDVHLVNIGDWSALMDTSPAFFLCAKALVIGAVLLNLAAVIARRKK